MLEPERVFPRCYLDPEFLPWVAGASPEEDGERLFEWLFADPGLKEAWDIAKGHGPRRVRLRIDGEAPALHTIPWELLRERPTGSEGLCLAATSATPFSRYLETPNH